MMQREKADYITAPLFQPLPWYCAPPPKKRSFIIMLNYIYIHNKLTEKSPEDIRSKVLPKPTYCSRSSCHLNAKNTEQKYIYKKRISATVTPIILCKILFHVVPVVKVSNSMY